eukprot:Tbor_TRINITY_DN4201_c0_g1::TRINITY_DN4201_c0_g1_i1::g.23959::m.23959
MLNTNNIGGKVSGHEQDAEAMQHGAPRNKKQKRTSIYEAGSLIDSRIEEREESKEKHLGHSPISDILSDLSVGNSGRCFKRNYLIFTEEIVKLKWRVLILCCCLPLGIYYIYDFPSALGVGKGATIQSRFFEHRKIYSQKMNQSLYSVYSYPNVILSVLGGILVDSVLGLRMSILLFSSLVLTGSFAFYLGVEFASYELLMTGRFIFGLGGESLCVAINGYTARWFKGGRGLAFAFGITLSCLRLGSSANFFLSPWFAERYGVAFATLVGTFVCAFSSCCCVVLVLVDQHAENKQLLLPQELGDTQIDEITGERTKIAFKKRMKTIFSQICSLPPQHWLLCCVCVSLYGSDLPFVGIAKNFFETKFKVTSDSAGRSLSVYQMTAALASPIVGLLCDRIGRSSYILIFASAGFAFVHALMIFTYIPPVSTMIMLGILYSFLVGSLWPSVVFLVRQRMIGVSYGVMVALQCFGNATIPLIVGIILDRHLEEVNDNKNNNSSLTEVTSPKTSGGSTLTPLMIPAQSSLIGYYYVEALMISFAIIALVFIIILVIVDKNMSGGILCLGAAQRSHITFMRDHQDMDCNEFYRANNYRAMEDNYLFT